MAQQLITLAKEETSQAILDILNNSEYGQEALEDILTNSSYGLNAIKGLVSDSKSLLQNSTYGLSALKTLINGVSTTAGKKLKFKGLHTAQNNGETISINGHGIVIMLPTIKNSFVKLTIDGITDPSLSAKHFSVLVTSSNSQSNSYGLVTQIPFATSFVATVTSDNSYTAAYYWLYE